jgi:hypothetical protein
MAHPLTHLTHGIPTRRPFHPAKTASAPSPNTIAECPVKQGQLHSAKWTTGKPGGTISERADGAEKRIKDEPSSVDDD